jgi:hypothetical protein
VSLSYEMVCVPVYGLTVAVCFRSITRKTSSCISLTAMRMSTASKQAPAAILVFSFPI